VCLEKSNRVAIVEKEKANLEVRFLREMEANRRMKN